MTQRHTFTNLLYTSFQLVALEEDYEDGLVNAVTLNNNDMKKNYDMSNNAEQQYRFY